MSYFTLTMSVLMERYSLGLSDRLEQSYEEQGERDRGREEECVCVGGGGGGGGCGKRKRSNSTL